MKKYIAYGNVPYHVPQIILNYLKTKMYQEFRTKRLRNNIDTRVGYNVPEYAIEILPPLSVDELNNLAKSQRASQATLDED